MTSSYTQTTIFPSDCYVMAAPKCAWCKQAIRGPKLVFKENWCCSTCMYYLDKGELPPGGYRE